MSREITFRVKGTTGDKLWFYVHIPRIFDRGSLWYEGLDWDTKGEGLDWDTKGEGTGLRDKNGHNIYEGDVVNLLMWQGNVPGFVWEPGVIKWYQPSAAFKWFSLEEDASDGNNYWLSQADENQREVIGNIHENTDML